MTERERFIRTLKREKIGGRVPHFELVFFLTMETQGRVHINHRNYAQWNQMSPGEQRVQLQDLADMHIEIAQRYGHSAILLHENPPGAENLVRMAELIREKIGDEYFILALGDPTHAIPDGDSMMDFSVRMMDEPDALNEESAQRVEEYAARAERLHKMGHLIDGFALCSDYCFNTNPFFSPTQFSELVAPYLKDIIRRYHDMGYYVIKHTDGNIMPVVDQMVQCGPDAIHSLDPQGGVDLLEVKRLYGDRVALVGNVNCGLLQTGTEEECTADIRRALHQGMEGRGGYIFSTSNCIYTGMPLERYELMNRIWREEGMYPE